MRNVENHKIFETFELNYKENINDNEMIFEGNIKPSITGEYEYAIRVFPYKKGLVNKFILGLIRWI
jgi:hypothetical protein